MVRLNLDVLVIHLLLFQGNPRPLNLR
jgi:hypothetical protein